MGKDTYQLLLEGTFVSGCSANKAKNSLSKIFHIDLAKIDKLFENAPVIIKKNLSNETPSSSTQDEMRNKEIIKNLEKNLNKRDSSLRKGKGVYLFWRKIWKILNIWKMLYHLGLARLSTGVSVPVWA